MVIPLKYNLRSLLVRKLRTGLTVSGIALVVMTFTVMIAMLYGLRTSLVTTGLPDNVLVLEKSALPSLEFSGLDRNVLNVIKYLPHIKKIDGKPLLSPEFYASTWVHKKGIKEDKWLTIRGVTSTAFDLYDRVKMIKGDMPRAEGEVIVGRLVSAKLGNINVGDKIFFGRRGEWKVVGIFEAGGSAYEGEIWAALDYLMVDFNRDKLSSITLKVDNPSNINLLCDSLNNNTRILVSAQPETEYYSNLSRNLKQMFFTVTIIALVMAVSAIFGGMNTMYTAVASRVREIGTLRTLGFSKGSIMLSFIIESLIIALIGGCIGGLTCWWFINGIPMTALTMVFRLKITGYIFIGGMVFSSFIGMLGGYLPARYAARLSVKDAIQHI